MHQLSCPNSRIDAIDRHFLDKIPEAHILNFAANLCSNDVILLLPRETIRQE